MKKDKLIPKRRFKEFENDEAWERRKLGDILKYEQPTKYIVENTNYDDSFPTPVLTAGQSFILGYTSETDGIKNADKNNPVIIFDDFTTSSHYVDFPFKVKSSAMKLLSLREEDYNFYFIYNALKNINYMPENHERHWISKFADFVVLLPKYEEQIKIGFFFKQLDNLITLHQRKLKKLKELKLAYLSEMFPEEGEKYPKRRFAGFTEPWEQRKLGDIADRYDNFRIPVASNLRVAGNTPYYGANGIQDYVEGYTHDGEYVLLAEDGANDLKNYPVQYVNGKIWANNHVHVIKGKDKIASNKYLKYSISQINVEPFLVGGSRAKLNAEVMMNLNINLPKSYEEQTAIGDYFEKLDNLITLHQRKLEKLENMKKAYLNEMFV